MKNRQEKVQTEDMITESALETVEDIEAAEIANKAEGFASLDIKPEILRAVEELGFAQMTPIQKQAIPALLGGQDVIGQAQTGTGKTAAFGIPILQMVDPDNKNLQTVILCPTRELAMQAAEDLRDFSKYLQGVKVLPVYGGQDILRQIRGLKGVQVIVGTPGRVMDHMRRHTIKMDKVSMVILDEADEMLDMGFREDMEVILGEITHEHQTCLFSATMPQEILDLTTKFQQNPILIKVTRKELTVDRIRQYCYGVKHEYKTEALVRLLSYYRYSRSIVFCNTKAMVDELANTLTKAGYAAEGLHGDLTQKQRDSVMGRFRNGHLNILIATDIAARGIDVDDVEAVFNYDIPTEAEYYVHRIGRTGRAGKEGVSHSLCRSKDFRRLHMIEEIVHAKMEERKIPSVDEIKVMQEQQALDKVMASLNEGHSGSLIPLIRRYCEENGISVEAFAAAALKMQMADAPEDVDVDLPAAKKSKRDKAERKNRDDKKDKFGRKNRDDKKDKFERKNRDDKKDKFERKDRDGKRDKFERKERDSKRDKFEHRNHDNKRDSFEHEDRHSRREKARRSIEKAIKDVRLNGKAYKRRK